MRILSEPKNALTKQYQKLFELDNVKLEFTPEAVWRRSPIWRWRERPEPEGCAPSWKTVMMDLMYEIPSDPMPSASVRITKDAVDRNGKAGDRVPGCCTGVSQNRTF